MKDQYPQGNTLNEQQEEWKETHTSSNISRNSTKRYKPIASRKKISANLHRTNRPHRRWCPYQRPTDKQFSDTEYSKTISCS